MSFSGPGVRFPPPLVFVAGYVLGLLANRQLEFLIDGDGPGPVQNGLAFALLVGGIAVMLWGLLTFARARTAVMPMHRASRLIRHGPYRFSRNPMYVGLTLAYVGLAVGSNLAWPLIFLPLALLALWRFVIRREEAYLDAEFGEEYAAFRRDVRRWL